MSSSLPPQPPPLGAARVAGLGLAAGALAGLGEMAYVLLRRRFAGAGLAFRSVEAVWTTPLVAAVLFALVAFLLWLPVRRWPAARAQRLLLGTLGGLALLNVLLLFGPLHPAAAVALALGAGFRLGQSPVLGSARLGRVAQFGGVGLTILLVVAGATRLAGRARRADALPAEAAATDAPSVLLIVLDTVRAMSLSLYGYPRPTSPNLSRWAERGAVFTAARAAAPWTLPSHASIMTGRPAWELSANWLAPLDGRPAVLAERFAAAGYRTGGFVGNLEYTSRETGLARGFAAYEDYPLTLPHLARSVALLRRGLDIPVIRRALFGADLPGRRRAAEIFAGFQRWLDRNPDRPYFAFLNLYDAHDPYVPPAPIAAQFLAPGQAAVAQLEARPDPAQAWDSTEVAAARATYEAAIAGLDAAVGRLLDTLERRGRLANTIVVITADHGEEFAEHDLVGHGNSLFLPSVHVPLIIVDPRRIPAGTVVTAPVGLQDLAATMLDLAAVPAGSLPGQSLASYWGGDGPRSTTPVASSVRQTIRQPPSYPASGGDLYSAESQGVRLLRAADGTVAAFSPADDPLERHNLTADSAPPPVLPRLQQYTDSLHDAPPGP